MSGEMLPQPPPLDGPPVLEPQSLKVFGLLHVVFGGIGLMMLVFNLVMLSLGDVIEKATSSGQPDEVLELQRRIEEETALSTFVGLGIGAVVSVLILIAGIALMRRTKNCLKLSNLYAWVSLGAKVVGLILFLTMVSPAVNGMMEELVGDAPPDVKTIVNIMKVTMTLVGVLTPVLGAIYPTLSLILLNKPRVKEFLATYQK